MGRTSAFLGAMVLALGLLSAVPAAADVPLKLTHQGRILDDAGAAVTGSADLTFTLYDAATGGATVWSDQMSVDLGTAGFYSVELGDASSPINESVLSSAEVWLGLAINGGAELSPRIQLTSVPYAVTSTQALTVAPGSITTASIAAGAVTSTQLASVPWQKLTNVPTGLDDGDADVVGGLSCASGDVAQYNGTAWVCAAMSGYSDADAIAAVGAHYTDADAQAAVGAHYTDADALAALALEIVDFDDTRLQYLPAVTPDCSVGTGLWCETNGWGRNRFSTSSRYTQCANATDCSSNSITLTLNNNQHRSVMMSHLDWSSSRSFDVELSVDGGANYTFHKRVQTYKLVTDSTPYMSTIRTIASNLPLGANVRVRLIARSGRMHFEGFGLSKQVLPEVNKEDGPSYAVTRNMSDRRNTSTSHVDVIDRVVTYVKRSPSSPLKITYQDSLGFTSSGVHTTACRWRLTMDGNVVGREQWSHALAAAYGWQIWPGQFGWFVPGVAAGEHTFRIQVRRDGGAGECLNGWSNGNQENFFLVEEML